MGTKTYIFNGYDPYIGGLKPSFFMVWGPRVYNIVYISPPLPETCSIKKRHEHSTLPNPPEIHQTISNPSKTTKKHSETKPHPPTPKKKHGPYMVFFFFAYKSCFFFEKKTRPFLQPALVPVPKNNGPYPSPSSANGRVDALPVAPQRSPSHRVGSEKSDEMCFIESTKGGVRLGLFSHHFFRMSRRWFQIFFFSPRTLGK